MRQAKKNNFKFRQHITKRRTGQVRLSQCRHSMRQKFVFTPFYQMLHPRDRQNRLPLFYRNNTKKMWWYSSGHCSAHCSDRTSKTLILRRRRQRKSRNIFHVHRKISDKIMQQIPQVALTFDMTFGIITLI